ncbi:hypothetical protein [Sphingomonas sp. 2SG]|uniref:hypothetical protein n=1 Tax=Sphingomonas sp. 2SG TaxID=2502201 RepID=UPI0010F64220|nr:hypothetical protein [Sphingomonas sp. 2SG]
MLEFRRARETVFPKEIFGEPGWDLLIELFIADAKGRRLTGSDVSARNNIAPSTLSRWLIHLSKSGYIVGDGTGDLDDALVLSPLGLAHFEIIIGKLAQLHESVER